MYGMVRKSIHRSRHCYNMLVEAIPESCAAQEKGAEPVELEVKPDLLRERPANRNNQYGFEATTKTISKGHFSQ